MTRRGGPSVGAGLVAVLLALVVMLVLALLVAPEHVPGLVRERVCAPR